MWLINSPIGRKVVMSVTGVCLILFLTFHCCMNVAAFFSGDAYNTVCEFHSSPAAISFMRSFLRHRTVAHVAQNAMPLQTDDPRCHGLLRTCSYSASSSFSDWYCTFTTSGDT